MLDKYRVCLGALAAAIAFTGVGCSRSQPVAPVSAPRVTEGTPAPAPTPAPVTPSVSPAPVEPTSPAPALLQQMISGGWKLSALQGLPPRERPVNEQGQNSLYYQSGALRLFQNAEGNLTSLVVDHTHPAYREFEGLTSRDGFVVAHKSKYTSVLRTAPIGAAVRTELGSREWTQEELTARLGDPSSRVHNHGVGTMTVTYLSQGLVFEQATTLRLLKTSAEEIWRREAEGLVSWPASVDQLLDSGKASPDGRFRAGYLKGGGYWSQALVVREIGTIEAVYPASYFIENYFWLDSRRLVYGEVQIASPYRIHVIDVVAGKSLEPITVDDKVKEFGPAEGGMIWYIGKDRKRHQVAAPMPSCSCQPRT